MDRRPLKDKPDPLFEMLHRPVGVHPAVRVAMALVVLLGGAALSLFGTVMLVTARRWAGPHPVGVVPIALVSVALGCAFLYVGWWLLRGNDASKRLVGVRGQRAFGVVAGAAAIGMMFAAWHADSIQPAIQALGTGVFSWVLLRSSTSHENG